MPLKDPPVPYPCQARAARTLQGSSSIGTACVWYMDAWYQGKHGLTLFGQAVDTAKQCGTCTELWHRTNCPCRYEFLRRPWLLAREGTSLDDACRTMALLLASSGSSHTA